MPTLQQTQKLVQHLSPQQILQSSILQLNSLMLEERILAELEQNPALEMTEQDLPANTDEATDTAENEEEIDWEELLNSPEDYNVSRFEDYSKEEVDIQLAASEEFVENLTRQLVDLGLSEEDLRIADEILGNINNEGYLTAEPVLVADRLQVSEEAVEEVRQQIMHLNPPGVGAVDLQECLIAQLEAREVDGLALALVANHFEDFANRRYHRVMQALGCTEEELQETIDVVTRLNPKPGIGGTTVIGEYIVPDLLVEEQDGKWVITLNDTTLPELNVSPAYISMLSGQKGVDSEARQFVRRKVESARWFIQAVQQRRDTMVRVMGAIIARQKDFFRTGTGHLRPMVLKDIAEDVNMDISTISRVTNGKYVQTPHQIYELKYFFTEGMTTDQGEEVSTRLIKEELQKLIEGEDKRKPLNDEALAGKLNEMGYPVARRTVAKYREQLKVPVARLRREL
ncbi:MAG: RNA polymerase factor sigma-54 [Fidelibacterota bacterium]|nr:MAG: RNA polymerase factor sigma-54 [Candidatus Neomarinimicrobiota bacterium]